MLKKVLIGEFKHETNIFCSVPTTKADYEARSLKYGENIISYFEGKKVELGGIIEACRQNELEILPVIAANASPGGIVSSDFFEHVKEELFEAIDQIDDLEGIILSLHGAMVTEDTRDGDGELLMALREKTGPDVFIVATLDLHANLTSAMIQAADVLFPYDSYPHVDYYDRGFEAGNCMAKLLSGKIRPFMKARWLPILVPALTTLLEPMASLNDRSRDWEERDSAINVTIVHGFPWGDTENSMLSVLVTTNSDETLAEEILQDMDKAISERTGEFVSSSIPTTDAVRRAMNSENGPVVLAEEADNPGGGAPCDGTFLLSELIARNVCNAALAVIVDPETVAKAISVGVGNRGSFLLGGKVEDSKINGISLEVSASVKTISDGVFTNKGPMANKLVNRLGRTVVLEIGGIDVIVSEQRVQPWDPEIFRRHGIEPTEKQILAVKSAAHYRAAFSKFAAEMINVTTPGLLSADFNSFHFKNIPDNVFPLAGQGEDKK